MKIKFASLFIAAVFFLGRNGSGLQYNDELPDENGNSYIPNDQYQFGLDSEGRMYLDGSLPTTYFADGGPGARLVMQGDGNMVLYDASGVAVYASNTQGNHGAYFYLDDGPGFGKIYSINGELLKVFRPEGCIGSILQKDEVLYPGQYICYAGSRFGVTPTGQIENSLYGDTKIYNPNGPAADFLAMQGDGNLVAYHDDNAIWSTNTHGHPGLALYARLGGLELIDYGGNTIKKISVHCWDFFNSMTDDELWASATNGNVIGQYCRIVQGTNFGDCPCNYCVKGRPSASGDDGLPLNIDGEGTGCVREDDSAACPYSDETSYNLYISEREEMCTLSAVSNAAAQLKHGIIRDLCNDDGVKLACP